MWNHWISQRKLTNKFMPPKIFKMKSTKLYDGPKPVFSNDFTVEKFILCFITVKLQQIICSYH